MNQIEEIMNFITSNLTGNQEKDIVFLKEQYEIVKNIEGAEGILRILSEMICTITPMQTEEKIKRALDNNELDFDKAIKIAQRDFESKKILDAEIVLKATLREYEKRKLYKNGEDVEYRSFNNLFEEIIYKKINNPKRTVINVKENFSNAYFMYSTILIIKKDYKNAMLNLKKATVWNPININIFLNCCEIFKANKQIEKIIDTMRIALKYAYNNNDISNCYKNLGYCYADKEDFEKASIFYLLSIKYNPNNLLAQNEFELIKKITKLDFKLPDDKTIEEILQKEDIQLGINKDIIEIAQNYFEVCKNIHEDKHVKFFENLLKGMQSI